MTLDKIISISGKPGLYEILSAGKRNVIVQSLVDKKRFPITAVNNLNALDSIAIYTFTEEVPLSEVLYTIYQKESGKPCISHKESKDKLVAYFLEILPEYDTERVYISNIKKVLQWYNILIQAQFDFETLAPTGDEDKSGK